jgi:hypothetical protein
MIAADKVKEDGTTSSTRQLSGLESLDVSTMFEVNFVLKGDIDPEDLEYSLVLKKWEPKEIDIKVDFSQPELVSSGVNQDSMMVKIISPAMFSSVTSGDTLPGNLAMQTAEVPGQLPPGVTEEQAQKEADAAK